MSIFIGGHPAHTLAAVMPLPEGLSEMMFAGLLAGRRFGYKYENNQLISCDADFCITGTVDPNATKPEGPFGDHLGYYSLTHPFPYLKVESVTHREGAVWPFTSVGRPPQEDTQFGALIHELTGPMVPVSLPGVKELHAVDEAGVHPLLLAVGQERYVPYEKPEPREILTQANAILGFNQCSLAKYLFIADSNDRAMPSAHEADNFLQYCLSRLDFKRDLHFYTNSTMDTLDYSGTSINRGSKLVAAAAGEARRTLGKEPPRYSWPSYIKEARLALPGVICVQLSDAAAVADSIEKLTKDLDPGLADAYPLIVVCDNAEFTSRTSANFLWVTFTRSNPSHDVRGVGEFILHKHWGCEGPLIIDATQKKHHAPVLDDDPEVVKRVESLATAGKPLHGLI